MDLWKLKTVVLAFYPSRLIWSRLIRKLLRAQSEPHKFIPTTFLVEENKSLGTVTALVLKNCLKKVWVGIFLHHPQYIMQFLKVTNAHFKESLSLSPPPTPPHIYKFRKGEREVVENYLKIQSLRNYATGNGPLWYNLVQCLFCSYTEWQNQAVMF